MARPEPTRASQILQPSDNPPVDPLLASIDAELSALESAVADGERAISSAQWDRLEESMFQQRRLTHALQNAMAAGKEARTRAVDAAIFKRLQRIGLTRDRHIEKLKERQASLLDQINSINRWKRAARRWLEGFRAKTGTAGLDQLR